MWATDAAALDPAWSSSLGLDEKTYADVAAGLAASLGVLTVGLTS
jgi:hypothetical protein